MTGAPALARFERGTGACAPVRPDEIAQAVGLQNAVLGQSLEDGSRAAALRARGDAYMQMGRVDLALDDFNAGLDLTDGKTALARSRAALLLARGKAYRESGQYRRSLADFDAYQQLAVVASEHDSAQFFVERGATLERDGQGDRAIADFNQAIELNVDMMMTSRAFGWRAMAYAGRRDFPRAARDMAAARTLSQGCSDYINNQCWVQVLSGEVAREARERLADTALRGRPSHFIEQCGSWLPRTPNLLDSRAVVHFLEGDLPKALRDAEAAVVGDPADGEKRYTLALVLAALGRQAEADSEFVAARRQLGPEAMARYVHPAAGIVPPPSQRQQAEAAIVRGIAALDVMMKDHGASLPRAPAAGSRPYGVAVKAFPDRNMPYHCVSGIVDQLRKEVDLFNEALGRRLFEMTTVDARDVLFVVGEPEGSSEVDPVEQRRMATAHEHLFRSHRPPHVEPRGSTVYYRQDTGELLYARIELDSNTVWQETCWTNFTDDLTLIVVENLLEKINKDVWPIGARAPADANAATNNAVLLCHHFGPADATRQQKADCAWRMIKLSARWPG